MAFIKLAGKSDRYAGRYSKDELLLEREVLDAELKDHLTELHSLVDVNVTAYTDPLVSTVLQNKNAPLSKHVETVQESWNRSTEEIRQMIRSVGCHTSALVSLRMTYFYHRAESYKLKRERLDSDCEGACAIHFVKPIADFNESHPRARITKRSLTNRYKYRTGLLHFIQCLLDKNYGKASLILETVSSESANWYPVFLEYEKIDRRRRYYQLRFDRAAKAFYKYERVERAYQKYVESTPDHLEQVNPRILLPMLKESVVDMICSPLWFDQVTVGWPPEAIKKAVKVTRSIGFAQNRMSAISQILA